MGEIKEGTLNRYLISNNQNNVNKKGRGTIPLPNYSLCETFPTGQYRVQRHPSPLVYVEFTNSQVCSNRVSENPLTMAYLVLPGGIPP